MIDQPPPPLWMLPPVLPREATCPHCYCNETPDAPSRTGPHRTCCKCGDVRALWFIKAQS